MKQQNRNICQWLLGALVIVLIIQVAGLALLKPIDEYDSREYLSISGSLFHGKGYAVTDASFKGFESFGGERPTRMRQPGYPLYLVLFYYFAGQNIFIVQFSQVVLNILTLCLVFLIANRIFNTQRERELPY